MIVFNSSDLFVDAMSVKSGTSGTYYGFSFSGSDWQLEMFTTQQNAYSLCAFTSIF